jgi:hypothetical protein
MLEMARKWGLGLCTLVAAFGCASTATEKSTGTNWITCDTDADCALVQDARCSDEKVCVDPQGVKISKSVLAGRDGGPGGGSGSGGASGSAGASGSGTASGSGGAIANGGASGNGNTGGAANSPSTGGSAAVDAGTGGAATAIGCFSPGQNLGTVNDPGAFGCKCSPSAPGFCVGGVALVCTDGRWQAVEDGPCWDCWTPDRPDLAEGNPSNGCDCTTENEMACMHTMRGGYATAMCSGGKWTRRLDINACSCTSDARCGYGSRCESGICAMARCEVDGMRYAAGATDIADPVNCNTCQCMQDGTLECTRYPCPVSSCPSGTTRETACLECGPTDGCSLVRTGCLPLCDTASDCSAPAPYCNPQTHTCTQGCP